MDPAEAALRKKGIDGGNPITEAIVTRKGGDGPGGQGRDRLRGPRLRGAIERGLSPACGDRDA
jgi:hypothetical protein